MCLRIVLVLWLLFGAAAPSFAATDAAGEQVAMERLRQANAAVVGLDITAIPEARSAQSLGAHRSGSGVLIGADGLILTIGYLIVEADSIEITTQDQKTWPARAIAYDQATGFGLVKPLVPLPGLTPVRLGSVKELGTGEPLMVSVGGDDAEVDVTQLVSKRPFSGYWEYHIQDALFTSPPVTNHSGAPLFNRRGELVGVGSLFVGDALGREPRTPGNMFVPIDLLKPVLNEMQATGTTRESHRPWLGLTSGEFDGHVLVVRVTEDGPAQAGGIQRGDTILAVDGQPVATLENFYKRIWAHAKPGEEIKITLKRGDDVRTLSVQGADRMTMMAKPEGI